MGNLAPDDAPEERPKARFAAESKPTESKSTKEVKREVKLGGQGERQLSLQLSLQLPLKIKVPIYDDDKEEYEDVAVTIDQNAWPKSKRIMKLRSGRIAASTGQGSVYVSCVLDKCERIVKIQFCEAGDETEEKSIRREFALGKKLGERSISPAVYSLWHSKIEMQGKKGQLFFMDMDLVANPMTLSDAIPADLDEADEEDEKGALFIQRLTAQEHADLCQTILVILDKLERMHRMSLFHGDLHGRNVLIQRNDSKTKAVDAFLIDFNLSGTIESDDQVQSLETWVTEEIKNQNKDLKVGMVFWGLRVTGTWKGWMKNVVRVFPEIRDRKITFLQFWDYAKLFSGTNMRAWLKFMAWRGTADT